MCFISMLDMSKEDIEAVIKRYVETNKTEVYPEDIDEFLVIKPVYDYENKEMKRIN